MKKKPQIRKGIAFAVIALFVGASVVPSIVGVDGDRNSLIENKTKVTSDETSSINNETEYWALLVAVGVYAGHPDEDRPSMLEEVENLHEKLLISEHWEEDHIQSITAENCTVINIIKGLRWLDRMDDKDDFSLVYITTHGYPLNFDIPPFDEEDKQDEALVSYRGFQNPFAVIWDDLLNLLLSLLTSKGVCVVVDSCHSGGFNDPPFFKTRMKDNKMNANEWAQEFAKDISEKGRVVLMSCREDELSYGSLFSSCLIEALTGYADSNEDGLVSAEEAFDYVIENFDYPDMHPTIYDGYTGELQLTEVEFPPSKPVTPTGQVLGDTNISYNYSTVSTDPEGGKISYGWDWDGDFIVDEWTDPVDSNTMVITSHSWTIEGTYNLRVKAKDEKGVLSGWSDHTSVMMRFDNVPDQQQTNIGGCTNLNKWVAQSFVPSLDTLSKVELVLESWEWSGDPPPLHLYIRDNLTGDNLAESARVIPIMDYDTYAWFTFDFENLDVVPGKTYYIVCEQKEWWPYWLYWYSDCYPQGEVFMSEDGIDWDPFYPGFDCCFVTWAKVEYPIVFDPIPEDNDSWVPIDITQLSFSLKDSQGDLMNYTVETVPDIGTGNGFNVGYGRYSVDVSGLENLTDYHWFVNVTDGEHWNYEVFNFKTQPIMVFDPFEEGWQYRKKITIDHNKVAGNLTDFPVLISVVDDDLKNKTQTDGDDILFMDNFGVSNRLFHEIESFDNSSGELVAWVKVTNLSSSADTVLYMYYGNSDCDGQEYPDHVWDSDYCGVWHLNDFLDSTSNNNDGINYGTDNCTGKIDIAKDFVEANEDYVSLDDMPEPADGSISKGTFEVWINPDELAGRSIICKLDTKLEPDRKSYYLGLKDTGQLQFSAHSGTWYPEGNNIRAITDAGHVIAGTWQHVVVVVDLTTKNFVFYCNGEEKDSTVTTKGTPPSYFYDIWLDERLGKYTPESSGPYFYDGLMDEVRISKTCRSADWVLTQYNNQNEPSSFFNVGPEET